MKVTLHRESFLAAFNQAAAVAPATSNKAALEYVLLTAEERGCHLTATDLEQTLRVPVPGTEPEGQGRALLRTTTFGAILRECPDEHLRLSLTGKKEQMLLVAGQASEWKLPTLDPEEFPLFEDEEPADQVGLPAKQFAELIRRTEFATENDSARYALGGVHFALKGTDLELVATDGRRLALAHGPVEKRGTPQDTQGQIVPARTLKALGRLLAGCDGEAVFHLNTRRLRCSFGGTIFQARLLEGRFPKYQDIIPGKQPWEIHLPVSAFGKALRQAAIAREENSSGIDLTFEGGTLTLAAESVSAGRSHVEMPVAMPPSLEGEKRSICLSYKFLLEGLKVLPDEGQVIFGMPAGEGPVKLTDGNGFAYVVMPLSRDR